MWSHAFFFAENSYFCRFLPLRLRHGLLGRASDDLPSDPSPSDLALGPFTSPTNNPAPPTLQQLIPFPTQLWHCRRSPQRQTLRALHLFHTRINATGDGYSLALSELQPRQRH